MATIKGEVHLKSQIYGQLSQYYLDLGDLDFAEKNLDEMLLLNKKFPSANIGLRLNYLMSAKISLNKGKYEQALEAINNCIELPDTKVLLNDALLAGTYLIKAKIYNSMNNYEEARAISLEIYNQKNLKAKDDIMVNALIELSNAEIGLKKDIKTALKYAKQAQELLSLKAKNINIMHSEDEALASAIFAEANAIYLQGDIENAIKKYLIVENIFYNKYKANIKNIDDVSYFYYIAAINCKNTENHLWFNKFRDMHLKYFGIKNRRSAELMAL